MEIKIISLKSVHGDDQSKTSSAVQVHTSQPHTHITPSIKPTKGTQILWCPIKTHPFISPALGSSHRCTHRQQWVWGKLGLPSHGDGTLPLSLASTGVLSSPLPPWEPGAGPARPASAEPRLCFSTPFITVGESGHWLCQALWSPLTVFVVRCSGVLISSPGVAFCSVCGLERLVQLCGTAHFPSAGWGSDTCIAEGPSHSWDKQ